MVNSTRLQLGTQEWTLYKTAVYTERLRAADWFINDSSLKMTSHSWQIHWTGDYKKRQQVYSNVTILLSWPGLPQIRCNHNFLIKYSFPINNLFNLHRRPKYYTWESNVVNQGNQDYFPSHNIVTASCDLTPQKASLFKHPVTARSIKPTKGTERNSTSYPTWLYLAIHFNKLPAANCRYYNYHIFPFCCIFF